MASINMISGKAGDKIKIDDKIITLQNSYKLITDVDNNKYYEIETNNNKKFKINENNLLKIINVRIDDANYYTKWYNKSNKIYCNVNNTNINIIKYLFDKINDSKFSYSIRNDDDYDFRIENIKVYKPSKKNTGDRFIRMDSPSVFYKEDEIRIIQEFQGHKIVSGPHYGKYFNNYRLVEIINETDESKKRYYEMFVGVYDEDDEDENNGITESINAKFSFIFDEASLPKILKLESNDLIINNPSWLIATVQYICTRPSNGQLIYLHRYLSSCKNGDNKTIDHINNNKLDNRLSNLRVATMSEQNMNRANVTRKNDLNSILNPTNDETIPRIETKSLLFINKKKSDGLEYFSLEISKARTRDKEIRENSSKSSILSLKEKLCHMIYKRYEYICKYPIIMNEQIDSKQFTTHSEVKINEIIGSETITYTLDSFLDYLNTKKIPKYVDPRIKLRLESRTTNQSLVTPTSDVHNTSEQTTSEQPILEIQTPSYTYKIDDKFTFIDNGLNSRDISIKITKIVKENIRISGSGSKKLSTEDKLCFALMNRYFALIEHENSCNIEIHKDDLENSQNITVNKNTSGKKTLTDLIIDGNKFTNFNDFKKHTEKIIKDVMLFSIPDNNFTIESFNKYIVDKISDKRCNKSIPILNTKYPILVI